MTVDSSSNQTAQADGENQKHVIVVPDDFPPVFTDSTALMRLKRRPDLNLQVYASRPKDEAELMARIASANTVIGIRSSTQFNHAVIEGATGLRHLALWGTATDNVAMDAARRSGITVSYTPNTATNSVAEHALALALTLSHRVHELDQRVRRGEWPGVRITQLAGKTVGIIGTGAVGIRFAEIAHGIGMDVLICPVHLVGEAEGSYEQIVPWARTVELNELLEQADVVSLHGRLSATTKRLIDATRFERMRPNALLINTARGRLINETDLFVALSNDTIAGAALDVFEEEPLSPNSPLRSLPNVILSPHAAASSNEALNSGLNSAVDNVLG
ncbi:MAG: NAD(P)-dependent oxidoreductase, partial [Chloroflexi bacterium]|nr:NAD(P)-dependent oxidoreductase [Chloroflexota bacterium]